MIHGVVTSAYPLDDQTLDAVARRFSDLLRQTVQLDLIIDPSLIAGITVDIAGRLYDGSFKGQLEQMRSEWT